MHRSVSFVRCGRMLGRPLTCSYTQRILIDSNPKAAASIVLLHHQSKRYQSTQSIPNQARRFSLKDQIIQKIKFTGPITIHEYMRSVLTSPNSVSYSRQTFQRVCVCVMMISTDLTSVFNQTGFLYETRRFWKQRTFHHLSRNFSSVWRGKDMILEILI